MSHSRHGLSQTSQSSMRSRSVFSSHRMHTVSTSCSLTLPVPSLTGAAAAAATPSVAADLPSLLSLLPGFTTARALGSCPPPPPAVLGLGAAWGGEKQFLSRVTSVHRGPRCGSVVEFREFTSQTVHRSQSGVHTLPFTLSGL